MSKLMSNSAHASIDRKLYWDNAYQNKPTNQTGWFQKIPQVSLDLINSTGLRLNLAYPYSKGYPKKIAPTIGKFELNPTIAP